MCCKAFAEAHWVPGNGCSPICLRNGIDRSIHCSDELLNVGVVMACSDFFELSKQPVITGGQVRAVPRVWQDFNTVLPQVIHHQVGRMGGCIVMQKTPVSCSPLLRASSPHCLMQLEHDLAVQKSIHTTPLRHPVAVDHAKLVKKCNQHALLGGLFLSDFGWSWVSCMKPLSC